MSSILWPRTTRTLAPMTASKTYLVSGNTGSAATVGTLAQPQRRCNVSTRCPRQPRRHAQCQQHKRTPSPRPGARCDTRFDDWGTAAKANKQQYREEDDRRPRRRRTEERERAREESDECQRPRVPIMKTDEKIVTGYTKLTFAVHLLIISQHLYTLFTTPSAPWALQSWWHPTSFTELVYVTTTCFHIAALLANVFKRGRIERLFVVYGTWIVWIGWALCLAFAHSHETWLDALLPDDDDNGYSIYSRMDAGDRSNQTTVSLFLDSPSANLLSPALQIAPFLLHGRWTSTTFPILSFFALLTMRRNHWGLITWEHRAILDATSSMLYHVWCLSGASAGWVLAWEVARYLSRMPFDGVAISPYRTDIGTLPDLWITLLANVFSGGLLIGWWSFWTFQYRGVVWKRELLEGVAVWYADDGWIRGGIVA